MSEQHWEVITKEEHDAYILRAPLCNLLQSSAWAQVKKQWSSYFIGMRNAEGNLIASSMVLKRKLVWHYHMAYLPRGPIMDYEDIDQVSLVMRELRSFFVKEGAVFVLFDPAIERKVMRGETIVRDDTESLSSLISAFAKNNIVHSGYTMDLTSAIQPRFHSMVHVANDFESDFSKHTKRHLKTAKKFGITGIHGRYEVLDDFVALMEKTEERKAIYLRNKSYFKDILDAYQTEAHICIAYLNIAQAIQEEEKKYKILLDGGKDVTECRERLDSLEANRKQGKEKIACAAALYVGYGPMVEMLYMGMDYQYRNYMPAFISHTEPMLWAKKNGYTWCNMGGIEPHMDGGLYRFKENFAPYVMEYIGEFVMPIRPFLYQAYKSAKALIFKLRKLQKK